MHRDRDRSVLLAREEGTGPCREDEPGTRCPPELIAHCQNEIPLLRIDLSNRRSPAMKQLARRRLERLLIRLVEARVHGPSWKDDHTVAGFERSQGQGVIERTVLLVDDKVEPDTKPLLLNRRFAFLFGRNSAYSARDSRRAMHARTARRERRAARCLRSDRHPRLLRSGIVRADKGMPESSRRSGGASPPPSMRRFLQAVQLHELVHCVGE